MVRISRKTKQKRLLEKNLANINVLFTGEDLFKKVRENDPRLGIATVYRFLKENREKGDLHAYMCKRKIVYSKKKTSHCHFFCEKCGKLEHITIEKIDFIKERVKGKICHFQLDVTGLCEKCAKLI